MIIKGGSRAGPDQLARHLQRTDTNETVRVVEVQSPNPVLAEAFRDWQTLSEGTRGVKGLYHANIDPAADYVMTEEQWQRCVEVLEKELGFDGQPRAVVMHQKHGRQHIHVVWARTDLDTMTLRSDSENYQAHERASKALEIEFGHEPVPGKHAKRDREKQAEYPRSEATQAEWQQGERTGLSPKQRRAQIAALKDASDSAQAFRAALEESGYLLAQGDRRDFVIVDEAGEIYSLSRLLRDVKPAAFRSFMKDIDRTTLPTAEAAAALHQQRRDDRLKSADVEGGPADQQAKETGQPAALTAEEAEAIRKLVVERQVREAAAMQLRHETETRRTTATFDAEIEGKIAQFDKRQEAERLRLKREQETPAVGLDRLLETFQRWWNPAVFAERDASRLRQQQDMRDRQSQEREGYIRQLKEVRDLDLENLDERHAQRLRDHAQRAREDADRYIREQESARRLLAELQEEQRRKQAETELDRDGPEWPPPRAR